MCRGLGIRRDEDKEDKEKMKDFFEEAFSNIKPTKDHRNQSLGDLFHDEKHLLTKRVEYEEKNLDFMLEKMHASIRRL